MRRITISLRRASTGNSAARGSALRGSGRLIPDGKVTKTHASRANLRLGAPLEPLVAGDIDHKNGRPAEGNLDRVRHVKLAGFHDRRHRVDELLPGVTRLADDLEHIVDLGFLRPDQDGRVVLLQEPTGRVKSRDAVL